MSRGEPLPSGASIVARDFSEHPKWHILLGDSLRMRGLAGANPAPQTVELLTVILIWALPLLVHLRENSAAGASTRAATRFRHREAVHRKALRRHRATR